MAPHRPRDGWTRKRDVIAEALTRAETVRIAVQVNGKLRGTVEMPAGAAEQDVVAAGRADANVARFLEGRTERRIVYVQNRLLNFVVE